MGLFKNMAANRQKRVAARQETKRLKIQSKTDRQEMRSNAKTTAYMNGINPSAPFAGALEGVADAAASVFAPPAVVDSGPLGGMNPLVLAGVGLAAVMLMKK